MRIAHFLLSIATLGAGAALAQMPTQMPPLPPEIASPKDAAYPGTLRLTVDATDTVRHIFRVHETVPVTGAGPMMLLYPRWLPGEHAPTGRIDELAGLSIRAGNQRLEWSRDSVDVYGFHVNVPAGATALELDFQVLTATDADQ